MGVEPGTAETLWVAHQAVQALGVVLQMVDHQARLTAQLWAQAFVQLDLGLALAQLSTPTPSTEAAPRQTPPLERSADTTMGDKAPESDKAARPAERNRLRSNWIEGQR